MAVGFKPVYRMKRCRNCPYYCKPCLLLEEAEAILADSRRRTFNGDDLCQCCHRKSVASEHRAKVREQEDMLAEIERLQALLAKLGVTV